MIYLITGLFILLKFNVLCFINPQPIRSGNNEDNRFNRYIHKHPLYNSDDLLLNVAKLNSDNDVFGGTKKKRDVEFDEIKRRIANYNAKVANEEKTKKTTEKVVDSGGPKSGLKIKRSLYNDLTPNEPQERMRNPWRDDQLDALHELKSSLMTQEGGEQLNQNADESVGKNSVINNQMHMPGDMEKENVVRKRQISQQAKEKASRYFSAIKNWNPFAKVWRKIFKQNSAAESSKGGATNSGHLHSKTAHRTLLEKSAGYLDRLFSQWQPLRRIFRQRRETVTAETQTEAPHSATNEQSPPRFSPNQPVPIQRNGYYGWGRRPWGPRSWGPRPYGFRPLGGRTWGPRQYGSRPPVRYYNELPPNRSVQPDYDDDYGRIGYNSYRRPPWTRRYPKRYPEYDENDYYRARGWVRRKYFDDDYSFQRVAPPPPPNISYSGEYTNRNRGGYGYEQGYGNRLGYGNNEMDYDRWGNYYGNGWGGYRQRNRFGFRRWRGPQWRNYDYPDHEVGWGGQRRWGRKFFNGILGYHRGYISPYRNEDYLIIDHKTSTTTFSNGSTTITDATSTVQTSGNITAT